MMNMKRVLLRAVMKKAVDHDGLCNIIVDTVFDDVRDNLPAYYDRLLSAGLPDVQYDDLSKDDQSKFIQTLLDCYDDRCRQTGNLTTADMVTLSLECRPDI